MFRGLSLKDLPNDQFIDGNTTAYRLRAIFNLL